MSHTSLFAVERMFDHPQISGQKERRFMVYKPQSNPQGVTWSTNISVASRWGCVNTAIRYMKEVIAEYELRATDLKILEV